MAALLSSSTERLLGWSYLWKLGEGFDVVAGLEIGGAEFFLLMRLRSMARARLLSRALRRCESGFLWMIPERCRNGPLRQEREHSPVNEHENPTSGQRFRRMLQGAVTDPFGHVWLIGKFLE